MSNLLELNCWMSFCKAKISRVALCWPHTLKTWALIFFPIVKAVIIFKRSDTVSSYIIMTREFHLGVYTLQFFAHPKNCTFQTIRFISEGQVYAMLLMPQLWWVLNKIIYKSVGLNLLRQGRSRCSYRSYYSNNSKCSSNNQTNHFFPSFEIDYVTYVMWGFVPKVR